MHRQGRLEVAKFNQRVAGSCNNDWYSHNLVKSLMDNTGHQYSRQSSYSQKDCSIHRNIVLFIERLFYSDGICVPFPRTLSSSVLFTVETENFCMTRKQTQIFPRSQLIMQTEPNLSCINIATAAILIYSQLYRWPDYLALLLYPIRKRVFHCTYFSVHATSTASLEETPDCALPDSGQPENQLPTDVGHSFPYVTQWPNSQGNVEQSTSNQGFTCPINNPSLSWMAINMVFPVYGHA